MLKKRFLLVVGSLGLISFTLLQVGVLTPSYSITKVFAAAYPVSGWQVYLEYFVGIVFVLALVAFTVFYFVRVFPNDWKGK